MCSLILARWPPEKVPLILGTRLTLVGPSRWLAAKVSGSAPLIIGGGAAAPRYSQITWRTRITGGANPSEQRAMRNES